MPAGYAPSRLVHRLARIRRRKYVIRTRAGDDGLALSDAPSHGCCGRGRRRTRAQRNPGVQCSKCRSDNRPVNPCSDSKALIDYFERPGLHIWHQYRGESSLAFIPSYYVGIASRIANELAKACGCRKRLRGFPFQARSLASRNLTPGFRPDVRIFPSHFNEGTPQLTSAIVLADGFTSLRRMPTEGIQKSPQTAGRRNCHGESNDRSKNGLFFLDQRITDLKCLAARRRIRAQRLTKATTMQ